MISFSRREKQSVDRTKQEARKAAWRFKMPIEIKCHLEDVFGVYAGETQWYVPSAIQCAVICFNVQNSYALDRDDETIRDLMLAGF